MNLNELRDKAYKCAVTHGWHEEEYSNEHFLCLVISELMEAVEADRKGLYKNGKHFQANMETEEEWRPVVGYEDDYEVSNLGRVRSKDMEVWNGKVYYIKKGKILSPGKGGTGYYTCSLRGKTKKVCVMVAEAFLFKPNANYVVNHIDGNKLNDNVGNLEYISSGQNNKHALVSGLRHPSSKISYDDMVEISFRIKYCNESCTSIYNSIKDRIPVTLGAIKNIKQRKRYLKYTDSVEFELADACIRMLDYFGMVNYIIDDSCGKDEVIEEFSRMYKDKKFTESIFNIANSITRYETQLAFVKVIGLAKSRGIDIFWYIDQKMKYNELRPYKHGDKNY